MTWTEMQVSPNRYPDMARRLNSRGGACADHISTSLLFSAVMDACVWRACRIIRTNLAHGLTSRCTPGVAQHGITPIHTDNG